MSFNYIFSFIMLLAGLFIIIGLSPFEYIRGFNELKARRVPRAKKHKTLAAQIKKAKKKKRELKIVTFIKETEAILKLKEKTTIFYLVVIASAALALIGGLIAAMLKNFLLMPVMVLSGILAPFVYIRFLQNRWKKELSSELETALSLITTSYLRAGTTFIQAVEENIPHLNPPVQQVFEHFIGNVKLITSNIKGAISSLKDSFDNDVWKEWIDGVLQCQDDEAFKVTLVPIVSKLSDIRVMTAKLEVIIMSPMKEYIALLLITIGSIPLMKLLNEDWFRILTTTFVGKFMLAVIALVALLSIIKNTQNSKPIEYRR